MNRLQNDPLKVNYNDSNNQKFLTIPSSNTAKPFSEIEPDQYVFPIAVDKRWDSEFYPDFLRVLELLGKIEQLMQLVDDIAVEDDDLVWLSEAMAELQHDRISKYQRNIEGQYNLQDHEIPAEGFTKAKIRLEHGQQMIEKYEQLSDEEDERESELVDQFPTITGFRTRGHEVEVELEDGDVAEVPIDPDLEAPPHRKDVAEFVSKLCDIYNERENKFIDFMEELGYEIRLTEAELGFHQFTYEGFIVEVPMLLDDTDDIEIYERDSQ